MARISETKLFRFVSFRRMPPKERSAEHRKRRSDAGLYRQGVTSEVPAGDDALLLRTAASRLTELAARSTAGDWRIRGLLASRPEVVAHRPDGGTEHVAEARADSARWIAGLSPAVAAPLADWLRAAAERAEPDEPALRLAAVLLDRLGGAHQETPGS
jgi:hypothetical protein